MNTVAVIDTPTTVHHADTESRKEIAPIPFHTVAGVELRKMFDTRSGFWLMAGTVAAGVIATAAVVLFSSDAGLSYNSFAGAVGVPMTILLPVMAILSVTGEWSQRAGLTTFTLVPDRGRGRRAPLAVTLGVGVASMVVALTVGAIGNLVASTLAGIDTVWNLSPTTILYIIGADLYERYQRLRGWIDAGIANVRQAVKLQQTIRLPLRAVVALHR